jgi:hypothetical protein
MAKGPTLTPPHGTGKPASQARGEHFQGLRSAAPAPVRQGAAGAARAGRSAEAYFEASMLKGTMTRTLAGRP